MKRRGLWLMLLLGLAGCLGGTRPAPLVRQYMLEYPPPRIEQAVAVPAAIRVERFSAARLYAGSEMITRRGPFQREADREHRWRISPSDMVTDMLRRDLRRAGLFRAVLTVKDREEPRFILEGALEECLALEEPQGRKALLAMTLTFLDLSGREIQDRMLFQKVYRCEAACTREGAAGMAEAMSRAMAQCSMEVIADMEAALKRQGR